MKIITKCIIDMETLEVVHEESYEYKGPVAKCGSGGGGGAAGDVDYPDHMKNFHKQILDHNNVDVMTSSLVDIMDAAVGSSPFAALTAFNPDTDITAYETAVSGFDTIIAGIDEEVDWDSFFTQVETSVGTLAPVTSIPDLDIDDYVDDDVDAFSDQLDDEVTSKVLPRFEGGMRNIGAVLSSAFVIGESLIEGFRTRDVAKHGSALRIDLGVKNDELNAMIAKENARIAMENNRAAIEIKRLHLDGASQILRFALARYSWEESYARMVVEARRIKIVAKKEETDTNRLIDEADARWDLGVFQYGANMLASISGGTMIPREPERNVTASTLGGAMSGAAAGAMVGAQTGAVTGPQGAVIGAVLGAAIGYLSA